ncbi:MAG: glycoside hydrolase family 43 protein [Janthinobacterium lividum]
MKLRHGVTLLLVAGSSVFAAGAQSAQPPTALSQQGWYADPEIRVFAGQYWIYPTSSDPGTKARDASTFNPEQQKLRAGHVIHPVYLLHTSLDAFSSPDLVHWTKHKDVLDVKNVPWAAYAVWAPSAIHLNGKYYLFFAANDIQKTDTFPGGIGVAVSDKPGGPFQDLLGRPLVGEFHNGAQPIDPMVYRDTDGAIYLYFGGQGHCVVARLSADLKQVIPMADGGLYKEITPEHYVEGPFMIKRRGVYYFMWSEGSWENSTYGVAYAKSGSPTGPFVRAGKILSTDPAVANGPGHHSVVQVPGTDDWYIAYHRHPLGTTGANQRVMAIDRLAFGTDGNIEVVQMTPSGAPQHRLPTTFMDTSHRKVLRQ